MIETSSDGERRACKEWQFSGMLTGIFWISDRGLPAAGPDGWLLSISSAAAADCDFIKYDAVSDWIGLTVFNNIHHS
jgi:hypothetical protein